MNYFIVILILWSTFLSATKTITIAGTADLQGMMEPSVQKVDFDGNGVREEVEMGGVARLATLYKGLKRENPNTVIVSAGDDLMGRYFHVFEGRAIFSLMSAAGYELYAFGNHEFDKGSDVLGRALDKSSFLSLCSDLNVSASALGGKCQPYLLKEMEGAKVGFFSLIVEKLVKSTSEKKVKILANNVANAKRMVKMLKAKGAEVIVLISHIGYKDDVALAKQVKGIDLIFGGHSHAYIKKIGRIHKTAIVNGGEQGTQVVKVDLPLDRENRVIFKEVKMTKIPVTSRYKADESIEKKLHKFQQKLPKTIILGETKRAWVMDSKVNRRGESEVANMINDLLKEKYKVDIVMNNAGAFRGKKLYPAGKISNTMLKEVDEFGNYAYLLTLKGRYIKPILEKSAANYGHGGLMHTSGLRYKIVLSRQKQEIADGKILKKGDRVEDIQIFQKGRWVALDEQRAYTLAINSFIGRKNGDGYFWFSAYGTDIQNTYATVYSIMSEELEEKKELTPKERDGRLVIVH
jgi:5'-nucleotidase